ncbi:unnamed protein product, partial [Brassica rapa subsp. trilocularis]
CAFTYYCIYNSYIYNIYLLFIFLYFESISLSYTLYLRFFPLMWTPYGASKVLFY